MISDITYTFDGHNIKNDICEENLLSMISDIDFINTNFEILSEEEEIDIKAIEKIVDGVELLRLLRDNEIQKGTRIEWGSWDLVVKQERDRLILVDDENCVFKISVYNWLDDDFKILVRRNK